MAHVEQKQDLSTCLFSVLSLLDQAALFEKWVSPSPTIGYFSYKDRLSCAHDE